MGKERVSDSEEMSGSYDEEEYGEESDISETGADQGKTGGRQVDTANLLNYESDDSDDMSDEEGMSDDEQVLGNKALNKRKAEIKTETEAWGTKKKSYY